MNHEIVSPITAEDALKAVEALAEVLSAKPAGIWFNMPMLDLIDRIHAIKIGCEALRAGHHRSGPARMIRDRVSPAEEVVHILKEGRSLCGMPGVPSSWPSNHSFTDEKDWPLASCKACGKAFMENSSRSAAALLKENPAKAIVHIVREGAAVCGKTGYDRDYAYVLPENSSMATCPECRRQDQEQNSRPGARAPLSRPPQLIVSAAHRVFLAVADPSRKRIVIYSFENELEGIRVATLSPSRDLRLFISLSSEAVAAEARSVFPDFTIQDSE